MLLAAGRGKRMGSLTDHLPKPLLKIGQFSLIEHLLFNLASHGFKEIIINLAYLGEKIANTLGKGADYGVSITYSRENEERGLETGGGIYQALPILGPSPFLVVSADIWTNYPFSQLRAQPLSGLAHLILVDNFEAHPQGDFNLQGGHINQTAGARLTFGNIGVYHPQLFSSCQPGFFPLAPLLHAAVEQNKVTGEHFTGEWANIGTPDALKAMQERYR